MRRLILWAVVTTALVSCGTKPASTTPQDPIIVDSYNSSLNIELIRLDKENRTLRSRVYELEKYNAQWSKFVKQSTAQWIQNIKDTETRLQNTSQLARTQVWLETTQFELYEHMSNTGDKDCDQKVLDKYNEYWNKNPVPDDVDWSIDW